MADTSDRTTVRLAPETMRELKHLAVDEGKSLTALFAEAVDLLLASRKQGKKGGR